MRFPDLVTIVRPDDTDEYGNPAISFDTPVETSVQGFLVTQDMLLLPASADIRRGDRVKINGATYKADPEPVRSPSKRVLWQVKVEEVLS